MDQKLLEQTFYADRVNRTLTSSSDISDSYPTPLRWRILGSAQKKHFIGPFWLFLISVYLTLAVIQFYHLVSFKSSYLWLNHLQKKVLLYQDRQPTGQTVADELVLLQLTMTTCSSSKASKMSISSSALPTTEETTEGQRARRWWKKLTVLKSLNGTNCTMSRRTGSPFGERRTPSSPSRICMSVKSALPTPTMMMDRGW